MSDYYRYLREFEQAVAGLSSAMDGMHQQHLLLKKQFRKYVADHETFTRNVRMYLDDVMPPNVNKTVPSTSNRGENDNERRDQRASN